jgi:hypothetical protein
MIALKGSNTFKFSARGGSGVATGAPGSSELVLVSPPLREKKRKDKGAVSSREKRRRSERAHDAKQ